MARHINTGSLPVMGRRPPVITRNYSHSGDAGAVPVMSFQDQCLRKQITFPKLRIILAR